MVSLEMWLAIHRDLLGSRRIRSTFDQLAMDLTRYAETSRREA
jgi:hypothetical protein